MKKWDIQIYTWETVSAETEEEAIQKVKARYDGYMNITYSFNFDATEVFKKERNEEV